MEEKDAVEKIELASNESRARVVITRVTLRRLAFCLLGASLLASGVFTLRMRIKELSLDFETHGNKVLKINANNKTEANLLPEVAALHIYIMAGQSNMVGYASVKHMEEELRDTYPHLWNGSEWAFWDQVMVVSPRTISPLTMGLGQDPSFFGPELGFGWTLSQSLKNQRILLIKAAWNAKSLAIDFRSPSSGIGNYTNYLRRLVNPAKYGNSYRGMLSLINTTLQNLTEIVSRYNHGDPYEFKGFVWFQGWNDQSFDKILEYSSNLVNLVQDLRAHLNHSTLPAVVAESGQERSKPRDQAMMDQLRRQQGAAVEQMNFSRLVPTSPYVKKNITTKYGVGYHFDGQADTMYEIGCACGRAMLELIAT